MDGVASPRMAHGGDRGHVRSFDLVSWRGGRTTRKMPPSLDVPGLEAVDLADSDMEPLDLRLPTSSVSPCYHL